MNQTYTAIVKQDGDWWIGWIKEILGINCQEATREELLETVKITLQEALEFNRQDTLSFAEENYREMPIAI
jgi:predicted RNase H-like HicB family nuclease